MKFKCNARFVFCLSCFQFEWMSLSVWVCECVCWGSGGANSLVGVRLCDGVSGRRTEDLRRDNNACVANCPCVMHTWHCAQANAILSSVGRTFYPTHHFYDLLRTQLLLSWVLTRIMFLYFLPSDRNIGYNSVWHSME
jgi:hypothetical protein